jgi:uncharacterized protein (DUF983 family)
MVFCFHKWEVIEIVYHPPTAGKFANCSEHVIRIMFNGFSNIHLRCKKCGTIKTEEEYGDARSLMKKKQIKE